MPHFAGNSVAELELPEIREITNLETLRRILEATTAVGTLDELRQVWRPDSPKA